MTDAINKALDLVPINQNGNVSKIGPNDNVLYGTTITQKDEEESKNSEVTDDFEYVREKLYHSATKSQEAVEDMIMIARQSQHPKAYEVLNAAIKTLADVSMSIAELQIKKQKVAPKEASPVAGQAEGQGNQVINNNLFVGSTAELQKMLEDMKNKNE
jgi:hypothetical protein